MRIGEMNTKPWGKHLRPVLLWAALALFFYITPVAAQRLKDLPAPPAPPRLKPTPTPTPVPPPKDEDVDVIRVSSNLVMVPVSVVDTSGQPVLRLQVVDFRVLEQGREQQLTDLGNPDQVPLDIAILFDISSSVRSEEHTSELQSPCNLVCRLLLEKKNEINKPQIAT